MTYSTHGISPQVETRKAMAMKTLTRLQRFRNLSEETNKRNFYITVARPKFLHPITPCTKQYFKIWTQKSKRQSIEIYRKYNIKRQNSFHDPTCSKQITHNYQHNQHSTTRQKPRLL